VVEDSIEGWSDALGVLMSSYFVKNAPFPEYRGYVIHFDYSLIRPKGAEINGGFKAPGPEGLRSSLLKIEELINRALRDAVRLKPIHVYDILMHASDAVLSGGVRRSATICLFSLEDEERQDKRPVPSDIRDTGNIESDADTICMIYRDEVYNADTEDKGIAELIIRKARNGATGTIRARWYAETTTFTDE
jgi:hypothetical protein